MISRIISDVIYSGVSTDAKPVLEADDRGARLYIEDTDAWQWWTGTTWQDYSYGDY